MVAGTKFHKIWVQHCRATRTLKQQFRVKTALDYLLGKKIVNLAEAGDRRLEFAAELPRFQAGMSNVFNARLSVKVTSGDGRVTAYASVIDAQTGDPTFVPAQ